jgi:hypothetical protein
MPGVGLGAESTIKRSSHTVQVLPFELLLQTFKSIQIS